MRALALSFFFFMLFAFCFTARAADFSSTNFINRDPVMLIQGGISTSTNFQLIGGAGQTVVGQTTSTSFTSRSGFFYYPTVTTPVITATAGDKQVSLTWTAATANLGWTVNAYSVGQSTVSGGSYSFTNVGNVLSSTRTSLTNGTTYYFVVRVLDGLSNVITTSTQVSATPVAAASPPPPPPPSGGGGGAAPAPAPSAPIQTTVNFSGRAYPGSTITLLKDAQVAATTVASPEAQFSISLTGLAGGNYVFSIYGEDKQGKRSSLVTFPVGVTAGAVTNVGGIFIAPTIAVDKSEVKRGDNISIFGQSVPVSEIVIQVNSEEEYFVKTKADKGGVYLYNFDTSPLEYGQHLTKSKASLDGQISGYSLAVPFAVSNRSVLVPKKKILKGDVNDDGKVNLVDFSITAFWYKRPLKASFIPIEKEKLSGDGKVDLVDFSIMAFHWTG